MSNKQLTFPIPLNWIDWQGFIPGITETHEKHEKNKAPKITLIKSFWKSRNLFSKRFLAAGGKSDAEI
jgi:hypothetical protein